MANTYSKIYIHFVFAVKHRRALIDEQWEEQLHKYITGIVQNKGQKMMIINGMPDHIHFLIGMNTACIISDLIREVKKASSVFIKESRFCKSKFEWQSGYGAFSYSDRELPGVIRYIKNQKEHHKSQRFLDEFVDMLNDHEVGFDEKYLFKEVFN